MKELSEAEHNEIEKLTDTLFEVLWQNNNNNRYLLTKEYMERAYAMGKAINISTDRK